MKDFPQIKISKNGCWEWVGPNDQKKGYGRVHFGGLSFSTHRLFYFLFYGRFDLNLLICHTCDNPKCVNPEHLFCGTAKDNQQDCKSKGRLGRRGGSSVWWEDRKEILGNALKKFKTESNIAKALGISRQAVSLWYLGKSSPGKTAREKLVELVTNGTE